MAGCLESYRADLRRGKNPFEGAFPLWRNEQFRAATLSEDPVKLETYAKIERAIMTAAEREETRRRNAADAAAGDEATFTGVGGAALAAGLGEDDGEEVDIEGTVAIEEGLKETEEGAEEMSPEPARRFDSDEERKPPVAAPVAGPRRRRRAGRSRRGIPFWWRPRVPPPRTRASTSFVRSCWAGDGTRGVSTPPPGTSRRRRRPPARPTHSGSSGGSGGPSSGSGSGSGDATTIAATHFVRPESSSSDPTGPPSRRTTAWRRSSRASQSGSETMGFHPSHRAAINPTHVYAQHATNPPQMYHPPQMTRGQPSLFDGASAAADQYRRAAAAAAAGQVFPPYPWSFAPSGATYPGGAPPCRIVLAVSADDAVDGGATDDVRRVGDAPVRGARVPRGAVVSSAGGRERGCGGCDETVGIGRRLGRRFGRVGWFRRVREHQGVGQLESGVHGGCETRRRGGIAGEAQARQTRGAQHRRQNRQASEKSRVRREDGRRGGLSPTSQRTRRVNRDERSGLSGVAG